MDFELLQNELARERERVELLLQQERSSAVSTVRVTCWKKEVCRQERKARYLTQLLLPQLPTEARFAEAQPQCGFRLFKTYGITSLLLLPNESHSASATCFQSVVVDSEGNSLGTVDLDVCLNPPLGDVFLHQFELTRRKKHAANESRIPESLRVLCWLEPLGEPNDVCAQCGLLCPSYVDRCLASSTTQPVGSHVEVVASSNISSRLFQRSCKACLNTHFQFTLPAANTAAAPSSNVPLSRLFVALCIPDLLTQPSTPQNPEQWSTVLRGLTCVCRNDERHVRRKGTVYRESLSYSATVEPSLNSGKALLPPRVLGIPGHVLDTLTFATDSESLCLDAIIPIGSDCGAAQALRFRGLRRAAFPFDWLKIEPAAVLQIFRERPDNLFQGVETLRVLQPVEHDINSYVSHPVGAAWSTVLETRYASCCCCSLVSSAVAVSCHDGGAGELLGEVKYRRRLARLWRVLEESRQGVLFLFVGPAVRNAPLTVDGVSYPVEGTSHLHWLEQLGECIAGQFPALLFHILAYNACEVDVRGPRVTNCHVGWSMEKPKTPDCNPNADGGGEGSSSSNPWDTVAYRVAQHLPKELSVRNVTDTPTLP